MTPRVYIKIKFLRGKTGNEIHEQLCEACGESAVLYNTVYRWIRRSANGKFDVSDDPRTGWPVEVTGKFHVEKARDQLNEDRRLTCEELAESLGISVW
jgi:transposase